MIVLIACVLALLIRRRGKKHDSAIFLSEELIDLPGDSFTGKLDIYGIILDGGKTEIPATSFRLGHAAGKKWVRLSAVMELSGIPFHYKATEDIRLMPGSGQTLLVKNYSDATIFCASQPYRKGQQARLAYGQKMHVVVEEDVNEYEIYYHNCDPWDIQAAIDSAEGDPQGALDGMERLILDRQPQEVDNYTAVVTFIDKVYLDPNKGKKLKRILAIVIPVLLVLLVVVIVLFVIHKQNETRRQNMELAFVSAVEYLTDENFQPAVNELKTAADLAKDLKDSDFRTKTDQYIRLVEAILNGESLFSANSYEDAQNAFIIARDRSRFTDNVGLKFIERRLTTLSGYLSVLDLLALGDILFEQGNYSQAESKYLSARQLASGLSYVEGRRQAVSALETLYAEQETAQAMAKDAANNQSNTLREAVDMEAAGDTAIVQSDLPGARLYYVIARERYAALEDTASTARIDGKLAALDEMVLQREEQLEIAAEYALQGDELFDEEKFMDAKVKYIYARNLYSAMQDELSLTIILTKIEACDSYMNRAAVLEAEDTEPSMEEPAEQNEPPGEDELPEETEPIEDSTP